MPDNQMCTRDEASNWRDKLARGLERIIPEPFSFAIVLTLLAMVLAITITDAAPIEAVEAWGDGLSALLAFVAQMALMVLFSHALAQVGWMPRALRALSNLPKSERAARLFVCLFTGAVSLLAWPLGLILGAVMVREVLVRFSERGVAVASGPLASAGFAGYVVWHMGYSASAPLFVATPGNAMEEQIGGLIPASTTLLAPWNLIAIALTLGTVAAVGAFAAPTDRSGAIAPPAEDGLATKERSPQPSATPRTFVDRLAQSRATTTLLGLSTAVYLVLQFSTHSAGLDLNLVNWTFLALGLLITRSAGEYSAAIANAGRTVAPLLLLYPLYTGVMGLMLGTGAVARVSDWVAELASANTLPLLAFLSAGVVNFFVPSGGAQWAVQGPAFVEAARATGTDLPVIVMSIAYGDQWTNLLHPFVVIPFALISKVDGRRILGGAVLPFLAAGVSLTLSLVLAIIWS